MKTCQTCADFVCYLCLFVLLKFNFCVFSAYSKKLSNPKVMDTAEVLIRYADKIKQHCCGIDPYNLVGDQDPLPCNVQNYDIQNYCIGKHSTYTKETFRAYKTLEAYKLYESGWVQSIISKNVATGNVCVARVILCSKQEMCPYFHEEWVCIYR